MFFFFLNQNSLGIGGRVKMTNAYSETLLIVFKVIVTSEPLLGHW